MTGSNLDDPGGSPSGGQGMKSVVLPGFVADAKAGRLV
jgi:hypothetical protein